MTEIPEISGSTIHHRKESLISVIELNCVVPIQFYTMLPLRTALRGATGLRSFSTSRVLRSEELSHQIFGPENEQAVRSPILFLHGLFGSKQNNRSISRWVLSYSSIRNAQLIIVEPSHVT